MAEILGKETIDLYNTSDTRGTSQSYGLNYQKTGKELNREMEQEQSKECILLIQNEDLTEFSLVNVQGMDTQELGNKKTREFEEYYLDVRYNLDTDEVIVLMA